jgi:environmental stress-induced protein Ves
MTGTLRVPPAARVVPWANGLGESRELLAAPGSAAWRIATTWIERDCAFSHLPGKRRTIVLLRGGGFRLDFLAHGHAELDAADASAEFFGAWTTGCTLVDGRVEVLNLILDESIPAPVLRWLEPGVMPIADHAKALFCASGQGRVVAGGQSHDLDAGHLLAVEGSLPFPMTVTASSPAFKLLQIAIDDR